MISSFDYYKQIESPEMYLCNPDQRYLCDIVGKDRHMVLRFNDLSELTFTVPKIEGTENKYDLIQTKRLIYIDKIGWFQISDVTEEDTGGVSVKSVTAESHQATFKDKGFVTDGRVYMFYNPNDPLDDKYDSSNLQAIPSVVGQLNKQLGIKVALNNSDIETTEDKVEWTIIYIDPALKFNAQSYNDMYKSASGAENICRSFEENTELFGYDFIVNNVEKAFKVVFEFDFLYHTIKVRKLEDITKPTDIYLAFDNLVNAISIKESAEDIVTVLACNGNDLDIRTVNPMGTNYIVNFDYYKKRKSDDGKVDYPWMSEELISTLEEWKVEFDKWQNHDDARISHERSYSELTLGLQELFMSKLESDNIIQSSNLQLQNLFNARDQLLSKSRSTYITDHAEDDTEDWLGSAPIIVETIDDEHVSLDNGSKYYNKTFSQISGNVTAYKTQPAISKIDGTTKFKYSFDGIESKTSNFDEMIAGYIDDSEETAMENIYLYFTDANDTSTLKSYCKINVKSVVGVSKDADGNIVKYTQTSGETWSQKSGTIDLRGVTFTISRASATGNISITATGFSTTFLSNAYFICNGRRYQVMLSADGIVSIYAYYVAGFDRYTTYAELTGDNGWCTLWENYINNNLVSSNSTLNNQIKAIENEMAYINTQCNVQKFILARGQNLYNELSSYWIEGSYTNDNLAVLDSTTMAERITLAKELMQTAEQDLTRSSQPTFELSVAAVNFIKLIEFKEFTKQLTLGRTITIEKTEDVLYIPALLSIEYDLDVSDTFELTFSNAAKLGDTTMTYAELLKETTSISRTVTANWANLTAFSKNKDTIQSLIEAPLDRTLRTAKENMASQAFVIDDTGILGRKYDDDSKTSFLPEQIRIINNTILFTKDNWETAALALGRIKYGESGEEAYGLIADVLVGNMVLSENMIISNGDSSIKLDDSGIKIKKISESGEEKIVFSADTNGNLEVVGNITAKTLKIEDAQRIGGAILSNNFEIIGDEITGLKIDFGDEPSIKSEHFLLDSKGITADNLEIKYGWIGEKNKGFIINKEGIFSSQRMGEGKVYYNDGLTYGGVLKLGDHREGDGILLGSRVSGHSIDISDSDVSKGTFYIKHTQIRPNYIGFLCDSYEECQDDDGYHFIPNSWEYRIGQIDNNFAYDGGGVGEQNQLKICNQYIEPQWVRCIKFTPDQATLCGKNWNTESPISTTSDKRYKNSIKEIPAIYSQLFDELKPVIYKYNKETNGSYHTGFVAQDVRDAMRQLGLQLSDFAGYVETNSGLGILYDDLIALCVNEIQKLKQILKENKLLE